MEKFEEMHRQSPRVTPLSHVWTEHGDLLLGCQDSQLVKIDCTTWKAKMLYKSNLKEKAIRPFSKSPRSNMVNRLTVSNNAEDSVFEEVDISQSTDCPKEKEKQENKEVSKEKFAIPSGSLSEMVYTKNGIYAGGQVCMY